MTVQATQFVLNLCVMVRMSVGLIWTTTKLSVAGCEGQNKLLTWNYSADKYDTIRQHHWYFNETTPICFTSQSYGFNKAPLYEGRVELYGNSQILLKNVSLIDTGEYTLYVKLAEEQNKPVQTIFLTVYDAPTKECKPTVTILSKHLISCKIRPCGRQQLSPEWRIVGIRDPVGNETYLTVSYSWDGGIVLCCPHGPSMECHNGDRFELCTQTTISATDKYTPIRKQIPDKKASEINTDKDYQHTENIGHVTSVALIVVSACLGMMIIVVSFIWCWMRKSKSLVPTCQSENLDENLHKEPQILSSKDMPTDPELHGQNVNQRIQIVNNLNLDSDVLRGMFESHRVVAAELHAIRKVNNMLQNRLHQLEQSHQFQDRHKINDASHGLKKAVCSETFENDISTSAGTTDDEDATSDAETFTIHVNGFLT